MKTNIYSKLLIAGVIFAGTGLISIQNIKADDGLPSTATTRASASFIDDNGSTKPVDPTDPNKPVDPNDPDNPNPDPDNPATGNTGILTLDVAPRTFDFGSNLASNDAMSINAKDTGKNNNQYLQVSDKRTDTNGWTVNVQQTKEFTSDDGKNINGTTVSIPKGDGRNSLSEDSSQPGNAGLITNAVTTEVGNDKVVFSAPSKDGVGKGISTNTWKANNVTLNVPKLTAKKGDFSSELKWSLVADAQ